MKKAETQSPRSPPKRDKLFYKNRWLISRDVVAHLRRAGVVCNIVVAERIAPAQEGAMSPDERSALPEIVGAVCEIKRVH